MSTDTSTAAKTRKTPPAWTRQTGPLTDKQRADRVAKYPNPETVNIDALVAATKAESEAGTADGLSYLYYMTVDNAQGRRCPLTPESPQWDPVTRTYHQWSRNPRLGDVTEIPLYRVMKQWKQWKRDYPRAAAAAIDNIAGALGVTYAPTVTTFEVSVTATIGEDEFRRAGYSIDSVPLNDDDAITREYMSEGLRAWLSRNGRSDNIKYKINVNTPA